MKINVILLLAGSSTRFKKSNVLKQFIKIKDKDLFLFSLETFFKFKDINSVYLVVPPKHAKYVKDLISKYNAKQKLIVVKGGKTRQLSVYNALIDMDQNNPPDYVMIHDAARPGVTPNIIKEHLSSLDEFEAISTILDINDSVIRIFDSLSLYSYLKREDMRLVQTPQTFSYKTIFNAHIKEYNSHRYNAKDDLSIVDRSTSVKLIKGSICNLKVTNEDDLELIKPNLIK